MSQVDLGNTDPLDAEKASPAEGRTKRPEKRALPPLAHGLLGSAGRIAIYAGATAVLGLIIVTVALLASGILAV